MRAIPGIEPVELPLADGGEGTAEVLADALGAVWRKAVVSDPLGRPVEARFLSVAGGIAVVESAEAIGLGHLGEGERDPVAASSFGLGELMLAAAADGARELIVTLGGSATVDGGSGMRQALGGRIPPGVRVRVACDVKNPLLGPRGAARVFGPQKGASPEQVEQLEARLASMADLAPFADMPGAGAAGGLGAALAALGGTLEPGAGLVLDILRFSERITGAGLVVTGEGRVDASSAEGKLVGAVAAASARARIPCVIVGGAIRGSVDSLHSLGATAVLSLSGRRERTRRDLESLGEELARLVTGLRSGPVANGGD